MVTHHRRLLGKTPADPTNVRYEETLVGHTDRVCQMANTITDLLRQKFMDTFGSEKEEWELWKKAVLLGCWIHDWGKANEDFQAMLRRRTFLQGIRHETVSLLIATTDLRDWLDVVWQCVPRWVCAGALFAASGHHLKFPDPHKDMRRGIEVILLTGHPDFISVLDVMRDAFALSIPPPLEDRKLSLLRSGKISQRLNILQRELDCDFSDREKLLIAATKSVVMAADLAGSALPFKVTNPETWIIDRLDKTLKRSQLINIVDTRLKGQKPREFQRAMMQSECPTTLVEAGCGTGKTAGAYLWAADNADGKRLYFCYPTTGTASEGFAGYLSDPDFEAILIHSRAQVDYELLDNLPQPSHEETDLRQARLEAMETWPIPAVVCTTHTVLGLLENVRRGIYAFPSLLQSAFVFDEIHALSNRMFQYLLKFIEVFSGAPILLMTATLPAARRQALEKTCSKRGGLRIIKGPQRRESAKRYILLEKSPEDVWDEVLACLSKNEKVLWVSNTVNRALQVFDNARDHGIPALPYHSRYRYKDRLTRHQCVVNSFAQLNTPVLAVTTQVAEMSLDLSANLLVSDVCPIASMIQRLGRLNRREESPMFLGKALFIGPPNFHPYDEESMDGVQNWLTKVADGAPKSQSDLAEAFCSVCPPTEDDNLGPIRHCEWLEGLWQTLKDRRAIEEAGYTIEIIREEDLGLDSNVKNAIPMPIPNHDGWKTWERCGRYLVSPSGLIRYDSLRGGEWQKTAY